MKLIRHGAFNEESPGLQLEDGTRIDASAFGEDYNEKFFANDGLQRLQTWALANAENAPQLPADIRLGSPVARPSKIVCIGLNFSDHAAETGADLPNGAYHLFQIHHRPLRPQRSSHHPA